MDEENKTSNTQQQAEGNVAEEIFETRYNLFWGELEKSCELEKIDCAFGFVLDSEKFPNTPLMFMRGHKYDVASILATILKRLKAELDTNLKV